MNNTIEITVRDCNGKRTKLHCANRSQFLNWMASEMLDDDEILLIARGDMCLFSGLQTPDFGIESLANLIDEVGESNDFGYTLEGEGADDEITVCVLRRDEEHHLTFETRDEILNWADDNMDDNDIVLSIMQGDVCVYDGMEDDIQLFCDDITGFFA